MSLEKARERWLDAIQDGDLPRAVELIRPFRAEWWLPDRETVPLDEVAKLSTIELQGMLDNYYLCICRLRIGSSTRASPAEPIPRLTKRSVIDQPPEVQFDIDILMDVMGRGERVRGRAPPPRADALNCP